MSQKDAYGQKSRSTFERKIARQRQLDLMEAAASGLAPPMELDTSTIVESEARLRNQLTDGVRTPPPPQSTRFLARRNLFAPHRKKLQPGMALNLMDHTKGIYSKNTYF
jgi:hypothetical protein